MKNILITTFISLFIITGFNACGNSDEATFKESQTIIDINVICAGTANIANYINLESNDSIVKNEDNTVIETYHDINGTKKVCLVSGNASVIRE